MQTHNRNQDNAEEPKISPHAITALWEELYNKKQQSWLAILSGSMMPLLQIGDKVLVPSVNPAESRVGNIIVFKNSDKLIVHRVIRNYNSLSFLQKGDNTTTAEIVNSKDVIGKVIAIRKGTRIFYLNNGLGKFINLTLTFFSCSVYYSKHGNRIVKRIMKLFFIVVYKT